MGATKGVFMKRGFVVPVVLAVLACLAAAAPAQAQDSGFKVFAAVAYVSPLSDDNVTFGSVTDSIEASAQAGYDFGFEWRMSPMFGLEIDYVDVDQDVELGGHKIGDTKLQPLSATLNFHLIHGKAVDFYLGPTFSYVNWGDIDLNEEGQDLSGELGVPTDKESAWGASVGLDFGIGEHFVIIAGVRYLQLDLTPKDGDGIAIDPLISRLGVGFRF
jgi:outer membrane protein W